MLHVPRISQKIYISQILFKISIQVYDVYVKSNSVCTNFIGLFIAFS